jgi:arginine deiminase
MDDYNEDVGQIKKIISYFEDDGVCMDNDTKEVLDNVAKDIGIDNLELINTEGNDEIYIRNEQLGIDYNVVSEPGSYEDYVNYGDE